MGWYALVRAKKPKVVVETGIDKGMGSCVLAAALLRNAAEGSPGRYYGIDINPGAGICFGGEYSQAGEILLRLGVNSSSGPNGPKIISFQAPG